MLNKKEAFTIMEIMIVIMIVGILSIGLLSSFKIFQEEVTNQEIKKKLIIVKKGLEDVLKLKSNSFIYRDSIREIASDGSIVELYNTNELQHITTLNSSKTNFLNFLNISEENLLDFANKPFDIIFEEKYSNHYVPFPYKNIFVMSWGKLNSWPDFDDDLKELFINNDSNEFVFKTFYEMESDAQDELEAWALSKNLDVSIFNKEISHFKITNIEIVKNKIDNSIKRFNDIANNISNWADLKIRMEAGTGAMPGKNNFMFAKSKTSDLSNLNDIFLDDTTNAIEDKMIDVLIDEDEDIEDHKISNVFAFIDRDETTITSNNRFTSTKGSIISCKNKIYPRGSDPTDLQDIVAENFVPISGLTVNEHIECTQSGSQVSLFAPTKKMMGVTTNFEGQEDFHGFPILISNTEKSKLDIGGGGGGLDFLSNTPQSEEIGSSGNFRLKNSPPYSTVLLMVFPWFIDATAAHNAADSIQTDMQYSKYGFYMKHIFSVSNGI